MLDRDLDALLNCIDTCTGRALASLEGDADVEDARQWVVRIRRSVYDYLIRNAPDEDDE